MRRKCRYRTGSRRSASSSRSPRRGLVYGNGRCLHDETRRIRRRYNGKRWIACRLRFRGWQRRPLLQPGRFTELFFLDDATAWLRGMVLRALPPRGLRPPGSRSGLTSTPARRRTDDAQLHAERVEPDTRAHRSHEAPLDELPDGGRPTEGEPCLVLGGELLTWTAAGYGGYRRRPSRQEALLITPPSLVEVLRVGCRPLVPLLHPSALVASRTVLDGAERGSLSRAQASQCSAVLARNASTALRVRELVEAGSSTSPCRKCGSSAATANRQFPGGVDPVRRVSPAGDRGRGGAVAHGRRKRRGSVGEGEFRIPGLTAALAGERWCHRRGDRLLGAAQVGDGVRGKFGGTTRLCSAV